jgi:hypothetical protein
MEHSYKYSVIRAIPDVRKGEVVNIGIVVFHPDSVDVRLAPSLNKLLALDAGVDIDQIRDLPSTLNQWTARFDSVEEKSEAIRRSGMVTLSEIWTFRITPALNYENQISALMKALVLPRARDASALMSSNRISTTLREIFRSRDILGKEAEDIHKHLVVPNFPIDADENLYAEFALRNGSYWLTETADFRARSKGQLENTRVASLAAIKLVKAKKRFRSGVRAFVVYASTSDAEVAGQLNLLSDYADELVDVENRRALARYAQQILDVAGSNRELASS